MNRLFLQRVLDRILVFILSFTASLTVIFLISNLIPAYQCNMPLTILLIAVMEIVALILHDIFIAEKATFFTYARFFAYLNIVLLGLIKLFSLIAGGQSGELKVSSGFLYVGTLTSCILSYVLKRMFDHYETFREHVAPLSGRELAEDLSEFNWYVSDYVTYARKMIRALYIITLVFSLILLAEHLYGLHVSTASYVSYICFAGTFILLTIIHTVNDQETSFVFMGHEAIFTQRPLILALCLLLCLAGLGAGAVISSDTAILKPDYFSWLLNMFPSVQQMPDDISMGGGGGSMEMAEALQAAAAEHEPSLFTKIMALFFRLFEYAIVAAVIAGTAFFLLGPFFSQKWRQFWHENHFGQMLKAAWKNLCRLIYDLLHMKRTERRPVNTVEAAQFRDSLKDLLTSRKKTKEKRAELDALTRLFMEMVDFGSGMGVKYESHMAPAEFTALLAGSLSAGVSAAEAGGPDVAAACGAEADEAGVGEAGGPAPQADSGKPAGTAAEAGKADAARTAGRLFEQALYAESLLSKEERDAFTQAVKAVCR